MLEKAFANKPFGDRQAILQLASQIQLQLDQAIAAAQRLPVTESTATALIQQLATVDSKGSLASYDSARQIVWALQTIERDLKQHGMPDTNWSELIRGLREVKKEGSETALPPGRQQYIYPVGIKTALPSGRHQFIYPNGLREELRLRQNYDCERLYNVLQQISDQPK